MASPFNNDPSNMREWRALKRWVAFGSKPEPLAYNARGPVSPGGRPRRKISFFQGALVGALVVFAGASGFYAFLVSPPTDFPVGSVVRIREGASVASIAADLEAAGVIRSPFALRLWVTLSRGEEIVRAGDYFFSAPRSILEVARRIMTGEFGLTPARVTIPEGATRADIARLLDKKFKDFDADAFMTATEGKEGYLFPDTYFFLPTVEPEEVVRAMEKNFSEKIQTLSEEIGEFGRPLDEVVTMASMLEKEGSGLKMRQEIAGVLWNRLEIDMPLQVDAVFLIINGKNTYQLTLSDLAIDSPYNTYRFKGLPPGPIANPSLDSLKAAVTPVESDYLFYLSDRRGHTYYARDFEGHKENRRRYMD